MALSADATACLTCSSSRRCFPIAVNASARSLLSSAFLRGPVESHSEVGRIPASVFLSVPLLVPVLVAVSVSPLHVLVGVCLGFLFSALAHARAVPRDYSSFSALFL